MEIRSEEEFGALFKSVSTSNPSHKEALKRLLLDANTVLSMDDLENVTGGVSFEMPKFESWSGINERETRRS